MLLTRLEKQDYIEQISSPLIPLMGRASQWDGIKESEIREWLSNFHDVEGEYFALKILENSLYYTEKDILVLLDFGLNEKILGNEIKEAIYKTKSLNLTASLITAELKLKKEKTLFVPLSNSNKPHESGQQICRYLTQSGDIKTEQCMFHWDVTAERIKDFERLIIVDDCIGSGLQLKDFWSDPELKKFKEIIFTQKMKCYYFVLVAYKNTVEILRSEIKDLEIIIGEELTDQYRVFQSNSNYWQSEEELNEAREYFSALCPKRGISMFGHDDLDFAVFIHRNVPDWSLPIFWKNVPDWRRLLPRKNSND